MATRKSSAKPVKVTTIVHEFNHKEQHRIVLVGGSTADVGQWVDYTQIAELNQYRAATDYYKGVLPTGIFTTQSRDYVTY